MFYSIFLSINNYIAQNFFMEESEEIAYYELPPYYIGNIITPLFVLQDGISKNIPALGPNLDFEDISESLQTRMSIAKQEESFLMGYHDCLVVLEMMGKIKFYYHHAILPNVEGNEKLIEEDFEMLEMFKGIMAQIKEIGDAIIAIFPILEEPFYQDERRMEKEKEEAKTLGLDKTTTIVQISLSLERWSIFLTSIFVIFEYFIWLGDSEFSARVRAADFCCITEIREVKALLEKEIAATKLDPLYPTSFSLRDVIVLMMMNTILQKAFFSDCAEDMDVRFASAMKDHGDVDPNKMRDYVLSHATAINEYLYEQAEDEEGFLEAIQPINDFPV